jgi:PAS domain S-box-containing protein
MTHGLADRPSSVPPREDSSRRRAIAVVAAALGALALSAVVWWHVTDLQTRTRANNYRMLAGAVSRVARMIDAWIVDREAEGAGLAEIAGAHGSDSTMLAPAIAGRILRFQMENLLRRGSYEGIWMVGESGRMHGAAGGQAMTAAEDSARLEAIRTGRVAFSRPEAHDTVVTIGIATPVMVFDSGKRVPGAAVVLRTNLNRVLAMTGSPRVGTGASAVLVAGVGNSLVGAQPCGARSRILCLSVDRELGRRALDDSAFTGLVTSANNVPMMFASHRMATVPWAIYYATTEASSFEAMRSTLQTEAWLLLAILFVGALAVYAYDRTINLRRLGERAQTDARFSTIVNTAMDAIIIVDRDYHVALMNVAAERMFRFTPGNAIGRSVLEMMPDGSRDAIRRALEQTLRTGEQPRLFTAERRAAGRRADGSMFPIDIGVSRTFIDGAPHLTIVIRDITEWKRAEEGSEWQRRVLEAVATGIDLREVLRTIARFHETQCPGVECGIHLIDDDDVTLRFVCAPSMRPEFIEAMDEIVIGPSSGTAGTAVYRREPVITSDIATDRLWHDYRALAAEQGYRACWATPIRSPQGRILGGLAMYLREARAPTAAELRVTAMATQLAGVAVDRAHAAESLRQSEASFRSFVENSPIGIYRATGTGRLLAVNASLVKLLGYSSTLDLLQVPMTDELFANVADRDRLVRELQLHGEASGTDMEWRRKDGTLVTVRVSARAYRDERGSVWFSEGFVENVMPLRAAEQAVRQSEKLAALGQLVSGVAHELNNPLAAILHFAEDLLDDPRSPADHEALSVIRDQARRSRSIVRDLLSFVRSRESAKERVSIHEALSASVKALEPIVDEAGARLVADLPSSDIHGNVDRAALQQVVTNLVVNAAQASGKDGVVRLHATITETELRFTVEDSGPGIPPKLMNRIFEPFFTTKPVGQGTGLGLSVTLGIVQQLGGQINVDNRPAEEGTGARFTVHLPIAGGVVEPIDKAPRTSGPIPAPLIEESRDAHAPRVLIIDDESSIRAALRRFFARRGWHVEEAEDGAAGLSMMLDGGTDYAAIVSDLRMPGCSGMELHDHVAAVAPELLDRIIFSTGDVASRDASDFVKRTHCVVMQKPFELRALEQAITRMRELAAAR